MPVLTLNVSRDAPWECCTCSSDYDIADEMPWETEDGYFVCKTCVQGQFERALEFDYNWPARFGNDELSIADFESVLSPELVSAVKSKAAEMAAVEKASLLEPFKDQTRGEDYQICPKCEKPLTLGSGCNHMTCHFCQANFCFLCGEEVPEPVGSDHWTVDKNTCPRYGPVGSGMFDPEDDDDDHEGIPLNRITPEQRVQFLAALEADLAQDRAEREARARAEPFGAFHIETWTWNVAFQSLRDDPIGQENLRIILEDNGELRWANFEALLRQHRPEHGVSEQEWAALFQAGMPHIRRLFTWGPDIPMNNEGSDLLHRGMLTQAVGGVFNMMFPDQRLAAFMWMYNTIRDWENLEPSQRSAVFDMGPGGDEAMRDNVADLMDHMRFQG